MNMLRALLFVAMVSIQVGHINAMQAPASEKSHDRTFIKRGLVDVFNDNTNFLCGRTSLELSRIANLSKSELNNKKSIKFYSVELGKSENEIKAGLTQLAKVAKDRLSPEPKSSVAIKVQNQNIKSNNKEVQLPLLNKELPVNITNQKLNRSELQDLHMMHLRVRDILNNKKILFKGLTEQEIKNVIEISQETLKNNFRMKSLQSTFNKTANEIKGAIGLVIHEARKALLKLSAKQDKRKAKLKKTAVQAASLGKVDLSKKQNLVKKLEMKRTNQINESKLNSNVNPLWKAAGAGDIKSVRWHLEHGTNVDEVSPHGSTAISIAAASGDDSIVDLLIQNGADLNKPNKFMNSPAMLALKGNHIGVVRKLVDAGADVNARNVGGTTLLMKAASKGFVDIVEFLIQAGANLQAVDEDGIDVKEHAFNAGKLDIANLIDFLIKSKSNKSQPVVEKKNDYNRKLDDYKPESNLLTKLSDTSNMEGNQSLWEAVALGDLKSINWHISHGSNINKGNINDQTPLAFAVLLGNEGAVDVLLKAGADVNRPDLDAQYPVSFAITANKFSILKKLIKAGANINVINKNGNTPLMDAILEGNEKAIDLLLAEGADVKIQNSHGVSALSLAADAGLSSIEDAMYIDELMENHSGKKPVKNKVTNLLKFLHKTSIWQAAGDGETEIIKRYIKQGGDKDVVNNEGKTLLMEAAKTGQKNIIKLLIDSGFNVNITDRQGNNVLQISLQNKQFDAALILLESNLDVNHVNFDGQSALWMAVQRGNGAVVKKLIEKGADAKKSYENGFTLLMLASYFYYFNSEIIPSLIAAGVDVNAQDDLGVTALMIAVERGYLRPVEDLVNAGASLKTEDVTGRTALDYANNENLIAYLNAQYAKKYPVIIYPKIKTTLVEAAKGNELSVLELLIKSGSNLEESDDHGATAIAIASRRGHLPLVKVLAQAGAKIDSINEYKMTPLHSAIINGHYEIAKYLIAQGANINSQDSYRGRTPLHWVVRMSHGGVQKTIPLMPLERAVKFLNLILEKNANRNLVDFEKRTALEWAIERNQKPLVEILQKVSVPKTKLSYVHTGDSIIIDNTNQDILAVA